MQTHLARAVDALIIAKKTTAFAIASHAGISHGTLSRACSGRRLEERTLRSLCTSQPDPRDGLDLLIGHLRDEVLRAGRADSEITIHADTRSLEPDLRILSEEAKHDIHLAGLLSDLAQLCRNRPLQWQEGIKVAENPGPYKLDR